MAIQTVIRDSLSIPFAVLCCFVDRISLIAQSGCLTFAMQDADAAGLVAALAVNPVVVAVLVIPVVTSKGFFELGEQILRR